MISVILAGGKGVRLWPESTEKKPKQLCDFMGQGSLLTMTLQRHPLGSLLVVCGDEQKDSIEAERNSVDFTMITEPMGRNTAPAVGLVLASCIYNEDEVLGFFPADHYIEDQNEFQNVIHKAEELANAGYLVTIGIKPGYPETGYGYIERIEGKNSITVKAFHEKPDFDTAVAYVKSGNFFWNAGIFIATIKTWMGLMEEHLPELYAKIKEGQEAYRVHYPRYPNISIDYAIAEKCDRMAVLEGDFGWNDIGSWDALAAVMDQDEHGNALAGDAFVIDSLRCLGRSSQKKLVLFGVKDLVVVETEDTILVCPKDRSQDIREVVEIVEAQNHLGLNLDKLRKG